MTFVMFNFVKNPNSLKLKSKSFQKVIQVSFFILLCVSTGYSQSVTFNYTGSAQTWVVPPCVTSITITAAGAEGGGTNGGNGAIVTGTIAVTPGQTLQINVGGSGQCPQAGWNGGGNGQNATTTANRSCGGGGATDIRISPYNNANRLLVASGGGGMGGGTSDAVGGNGGCGSGTAGTSPFGQGGGGATQTAAGNGGPPWISSGNYGTSGSLGVGGNGGSDPCYNVAPGGGGGGGYYGGGGGGSDCYSSSPYGGGSGGGGSSLTPAGGGCTSGTNNGPGYMTITYTLGSGAATATNTGPYCVGATIQLNGTGGTTFSWTGPNGFTSALQNPTISSATAAMAGTYNLTVSGAGCTATATTNVVVNNAPNVNAGADQTVCSGTNITLTGTGATTYSWSNSVSNGVAFSQPVGTTTYTVTGTTSGCTNTDQVSVTVNPLPVVNAGPDVTICATAPTNLTATGASTYTWNPGSLPGATVTVAPASTTTYTVTGTENGCTSTDAVTVTTTSLAVINAGPDVTMCEGAATMLSASGGSVYDWDNGLGIGNNVMVSPTSTTTYAVSGTDANGCTGWDDMTVTITPLPVVDAGPDQSVCDGVSVTLAGSGATTYSWDYSVNDGVAFTPLSTLTYSVIGTTNGCTSTDQVVVTVNPIPNVGAGNDQAVCDGTPVTLTGTGAITYTWDNSVIDNTSFVPSATAIYTVTGTTLAGCTSTDQVEVIVNLIPVVDAGTDQTVCSGTTVILNGAGANSYTWDYSVTNGVGFIPGVGALSYTVTGTSTAGCTSTDQVNITVNPLPVVNAGVDQAVCNGFPVTLVGSGAATYSWTGGISDNTEFIPASTTTFTVVGTSVDGCIDNDQVIVTVNPIPAVFGGNDVIVCDGILVTLNGSGANTYSWDNGISNGTAFAQPVGIVTYTVTGTSVYGCINTDQVMVNVNPLPVVNFVPDVTVGCSPTTVNFTNTDPTAVDCQWVISDGTAISGCGTVGHTFVQTGCHDVTLTVTSGAGCVNSLTAFDLICIENDPIASFIPSTNSISEYDTDINFMNTTVGAVAYDWDFGDNTATSNDVDPMHDYEGVPFGSYTVTLIAYSTLGCVDTTTAIIQMKEDLIFYIPNTFTPDGDMYNQTFQPIFTSGFDPYDFDMFIYNRWGEVLFESHNAEIGWDGTYGGELVQEGVYSWKIEFKTSSSDERRMVVGHLNILK